jgi:pimeloyl-ACP methyl ester carboxylesterase
MPQKPTIVSVHGVWGNAAHWSKVIARRRWVTNPSALSKIPLSSLAGDVKRTGKSLSTTFFGIIFGNFGGAIGFLSVGGVH